MLQLFYKTSAITSIEWDKAYSKIQSITHNFPLKLIRSQHYDYDDSRLDIDHFELVENAGTADEYLSFKGDWLSYKFGVNIRFFKDWEQHKKNELHGKETDPNKPITWFPYIPFRQS